MQQWKNSLIGMKRRDEAYSAIVEARRFASITVYINIVPAVDYYMPNTVLL